MYSQLLIVQYVMYTVQCRALSLWILLVRVGGSNSRTASHTEPESQQENIGDKMMVISYWGNGHDMV